MARGRSDRDGESEDLNEKPARWLGVRGTAVRPPYSSMAADSYARPGRQVESVGKAARGQAGRR